MDTITKQKTSTIFKKIKKKININDVHTKKIVLSNKKPYGEQGANKYYIAYWNDGYLFIYCLFILLLKI